MWIIKNLFSSSKKSFEDMGGYTLASNIWGGTNDKYKKYTQSELLDLYKGWVFACCDVIGDGMAWLDINLYRTEAKVNKRNHEYLKFLDSEFIKAISIFMETLWVVYIYKEMAGWKIVWLKILKSYGVIEEKDALDNIKYYRYFNGQTYFEFQKEDIIKIKTFTPLFEKEGFSPLKAVASQVAMDFASIEYNRLFFENGGRPWTILKHEKQINPEVREQYLAKWKENFVWLKNANKVAFLDNWIDIVDFSANQKDMELTNQRTFTMDEVLMIFRVPKPLLWKSDGVGFADRRVPWYYFTEYKLKPKAYALAEQLQKSLFKGIWFLAFEFPQDKEDLIKEYQANLITQNQYLLATWRQAFNEGDRTWDGSEMSIREEGKKEISALETKIEKSIEKGFNLSLKKADFWSEEYNQKYWEVKIKRTDTYEENMAKIQKKIWSAQEKEIIENIKKAKSIKEIKKESELFDEKKYKLLYIALYTKFFNDFMGAEGKLAIEEISDETFAIAKINKWIGENIERMSKDIDETTRKEVFKIVKEGNRDGVWVWQIVASVNSKFSLYTKKKWRIEAIVRSEITRASNKSQDEAYVQSRIVQYKEWYTAVDERVCPYCNDLNKKKIWLWKDFFKEGDTHLGEKITYENISYPPRHVNCRCTIRPIIKRKSAEALETKLKNKGFTLNTNAIENGE